MLSALFASFSITWQVSNKIYHLNRRKDPRETQSIELVDFLTRTKSIGSKFSAKDTRYLPPQISAPKLRIMTKDSNSISVATKLHWNQYLDHSTGYKSNSCSRASPHLEQG
ncbi:Nitrate reductase [NADPH] [Venturia inaequalis]|nr:Nitrate reductase [NADPH] [Venturia inaequalis]